MIESSFFGKASESVSDETRIFYFLANVTFEVVQSTNFLPAEEDTQTAWTRAELPRNPDRKNCRTKSFPECPSSSSSSSSFTRRYKIFLQFPPLMTSWESAGSWNDIFALPRKRCPFPTPKIEAYFYLWRFYHTLFGAAHPNEQESHGWCFFSLYAIRLSRCLARLLFE